MPSPPRYISYSLFTKRGIGAYRWWDPHERDQDRYWFNVPFIPIVNDLYYPGYVTRVHADPETRNHRLYPMLKRLSERGVMEVIECDYPFQNTEPTIWRLQPVWSENYDVVLSRDIDSLPNTREAQATLAFVASSFLIQSMRTHPGHNDLGVRMLAGLCAFRSGIKEHLSGTFDDYYRMARGHWGTDQEVLNGYFLDRLGAEFVKQHFLDTCVHAFAGRMQEFLPGHDAGKLSQEVYDAVDLSHVPAEVRRCLDALTAWPGQPVNARGEAARLLLYQATDTARAVRDCLRSDPEAKRFFLASTRATFDDAIPGLKTSSMTDHDSYRGVCAAAVADEEVFAQFRRLPDYTAILEHVTAEQGQQYLAEIRREAPWLLDPSLVLANDALGGPTIESYPDFSTVSPTTLRYLKVLADLVTFFGPLADLHVVEVGGGYGGQARLIRSFFPTARHTILDLAEPLALTRKYLERSGIVDGVTYFPCSKSDDVPFLGGDVFLSNYALSECAQDWFDAYMRRVALGCARGYITGNAQEATTFEYLDAVNPQWIDERPLTAPGNFICIWGRGTRDGTTGR
jgi:hypothetical protein